MPYTPPVQVVVQDKGVEKRFAKLVQTAYDQVENRPKSQKAKRSLISWKHSRSTNTKAGREWLGYGVFGGVVIAGVSTLLFATIASTGGAIAVAAAVALTTHLARERAKKWKRKNDMLIAIGTEELALLSPQGLAKLNRETKDSFVTLEQAKNQPKKLAEAGITAEVLLGELINARTRLFKKLDAYSRAHAQNQGPQKLTLRGWKADPPSSSVAVARTALVTEAVALTKDRKLGPAMQSISGHFYMRHKVRGTEDRQTAVLKLAVLLKRISFMVKYLDDYFDILKDTLEKHAQKLNEYDNQNKLTRFVQSIIQWGPHHKKCGQKCPYFPELDDLTFRELHKLTDSEKRSAAYNWDRGYIGTQVRPLEHFPDRVDLTSLVDTPIQYSEDRNFTVHATNQLDLHLYAKHENQPVGDDEKDRDLAKQIPLAWDLFSAAGEFVEKPIETALTEGASATATTATYGADAIAGYGGFLIGLALEQIVRTTTITRPAYTIAEGIRKAAYRPGFEQDDMIELDREIKKHKTKPDFLEYALSRIHSHYLRRYTERLTKFDALFTNLGAKGAANCTCEDAEMLTRYYLKTYHYIDKAFSNLLFVNRAVEMFEGHVNEKFLNVLVETQAARSGRSQ